MQQKNIPAAIGGKVLLYGAGGGGDGARLGFITQAVGANRVNLATFNPDGSLGEPARNVLLIQEGQVVPAGVPYCTWASLTTEQAILQPAGT